MKRRNFLKLMIGTGASLLFVTSPSIAKKQTAQDIINQGGIIDGYNFDIYSPLVLSSDRTVITNCTINVKGYIDSIFTMKAKYCVINNNVIIGAEKAICIVQALG